MWVWVFFTLTSSTPRRHPAHPVSVLCPCWFFVPESCKLCGHKTTTQGWPWKAGNHLGAGIVNICALLVRRILDGKSGVSGRGIEPPFFSLPSCYIKGRKLLFSISTQPTQVSDNENLLDRQTWQGYPVSHTRGTWTNNAVKGIDNAMPCHCIGYGRHNIRTPATQLHWKRAKRQKQKKQNKKKNRETNTGWFKHVAPNLLTI